MSVPEEPIITAQDLPPVVGDEPAGPVPYVAVQTADGTVVAVPEPTVDDVLEYLYPGGGPSPTAQEDVADALAGLDTVIIDEYEGTGVLDAQTKVELESAVVTTDVTSAPPVTKDNDAEILLEPTVEADNSRTKWFWVVLLVVCFALWFSYSPAAHVDLSKPFTPNPRYAAIDQAKARSSYSPIASTMM